MERLVRRLLRTVSAESREHYQAFNNAREMPARSGALLKLLRLPSSLSNAPESSRVAFEPAGQPLLLASRALRWAALFLRWPEASIATLAAASRLARYSTRTQVMSAHWPERREVMVVVASALEISRSSATGERFLLNVIGPGQTIGFVRLLDKTPPRFDYHTHDETALLHVAVDAPIAVLDADPMLWRDVAKLLLECPWDCMGVLRDAAVAPLAERIAALLANLARLHGM